MCEIRRIRSFCGVLIVCIVLITGLFGCGRGPASITLTPFGPTDAANLTDTVYPTETPTENPSETPSIPPDLTATAEYANIFPIIQDLYQGGYIPSINGQYQHLDDYSNYASEDNTFVSSKLITIQNTSGFVLTAHMAWPGINPRTQVSGCGIKNGDGKIFFVLSNGNAGRYDPGLGAGFYDGLLWFHGIPDVNEVDFTLVALPAKTLVFINGKFLEEDNYIYFSDKIGFAVAARLNAGECVFTKMGVWTIGTSGSAASIPPAQTGNLIAFSTEVDGNRDVAVMNPDGTNVIRLTTSADWDWSPTWSPDGMQIAFLSTRDGNAELYLMNADGTGQKRLTETKASEGYPAWSPNGKTIAYVSDQDEPDPANCGNSTVGCRTEIYLFDLATSKSTQITNEAALHESPTWSPDGSRIAFVSNRNGQQGIYAMNADGTDVKLLYHDDRYIVRCSWSPDGKKIAFQTNDNGKDDIYVINTDGTNLTQLGYTQDNHWAPSWSPDGSQLVFSSSDTANTMTTICIIDQIGTGLNCLTNISPQAWEPVWQPHPK